MKYVEHQLGICLNMLCSFWLINIEIILSRITWKFYDPAILYPWHSIADEEDCNHVTLENIKSLAVVAVQPALYKT